MQVDVEGIGIIDIPQGATREDVQEILARAVSASKPQPKTSPLGHAWEAQKGVWSGVASGIAAIPEGIGAVTGHQGLKDIGEYIRNNELTQNFTANPGYENSIPRQAGEIAGNLATMVGPSVGASVARAPAIASRGLGALMGMMQGAAEQKREADRNRASGMEVSPEQETEAARYGAATGLLDLLPVGRLLKPIERLGGMAGASALTKMTKGEILKDIAKTGAAGGITEAMQQGAQNLIEQGYNPSQGLGENVVESGVAGLAAGAGLDALIGGIARRIGRKAEAAKENVRARQTAPEIQPGVEPAIGVRAGSDMQAEIRYVESISKAVTGKPMSELSPEIQALVATRAAELKAAGVREEDILAAGSMPTLDQIAEEPVGPAPTKRPTPGMPPPKITEGLPPITLTDEGTVIDPTRMPTQIRRSAEPMPEIKPVEEVIPPKPEVPLLDQVLAEPVEVPKPRPGQPPPLVTEGLPPATLTDEGTIATPSPLAMDQPGAPKFSVTDTPPAATENSVESIRKNIEKHPLPHELFTELQRLGADDIFALRLVDEISDPMTDRNNATSKVKGRVAGKYANQIVSLSLKNANDLKGTLNHEVVHGFKELGLFNETEWNILKTALNPNAVLSDNERDYYNKRYGNKPDMITEEAIARGLGRHATGEAPIGGTAGAIANDKIGLLDRIGSMFKSKGLDTPESVAKAFREGDIGKRNFDGAAAETPPVPDTTTLDDLFSDTDEEGYVKGTPPVEKASIQQLPVAGRFFAPADPRSQLRKQWDEVVSPKPLKPGQTAPLKGKLRQQALDSRAGIEALSRKAGDSTVARTSAIAAVRNADVASDLATAMLKHGAGELVGTPQNGYIRASENGPHPYGEGGFFTKAYQQKKFDRVMAFLAGSRGGKLMIEGREHKLTPAQIATYKNYGRDPEVKAAADQWKTFNGQMLDMLKSSGRFSEETIDNWKQGYYLPFNRFDPDAGFAQAPSGGTLASPGNLPALKGSDQLSADPTENIVRNVNAITQMAMSNVARQRIARDGTALGYMKPAVKGAKNTITIYYNGKPRKFEITDQLLYDSVTASRLPVNLVMKLAAMPGNFLRESVTLSPPFMIRNMLRDSMAVWAQGYTPAPFLNIIGDASHALSEGRSFQALERMGVVGSGIRGEGGASGTAENVRSVMDSSSMNTLEKALKYIEDRSRKSEATNRVTVYDSVMKRTGGDEAQAAYEARELLNFNRRGANPVAQVLTALIPFQNARWQGFDVGLRSATGRGANPHMKRQMITRALYLSGLTAIYTALASQLPAWQQASEEERENYWFVPTGTGEAIRVPVPFEFGFAAKILPERLTAMMMGEEGGKELLGAFSRFAASTMKLDIVPQAAAPIAEVAVNYDRFRGKEIEAPWMKKLESNYRAEESTTELAKSIAPYAPGLSPVQVDHLLRGYLGTAAMYGVNLADFLIGPESVGAIPGRKMSQMPVIGTLFQREDGPRKLIEFYAVRETAEQATATLKAAQKAHSPLDKEEQQRMGKLARFEKLTRKADERMSMATKIERQIRSDMKAGRLTPSQGRKTLEELRKQKIAIAEPVVKLSKKEN